jgi:ParB/RepB/Spo0J family partition protein
MARPSLLELPVADQLLSLPLTALSPDPQQPRREMENDSNTVTEAHTLQGLANSIAVVGILQPIRVRMMNALDGVPHYQIVSGQRRFEAARMAGLMHVPCLLVEDTGDASHTLVSQVTENLQRKSMTPSELAVAVQTLVMAGATQDEVAGKLGIQASQVSLLLNLLVLTGPVKVAFQHGRIESPRAAYDLNKLPEQLQEQLIGEAEAKGRVVTQRDVREVKQLHAKKLAEVRHRYEVPAVTTVEYAAFTLCLEDGVLDTYYNPNSDRDSVFGQDWGRLEAQQIGFPGSKDSAMSRADADRVDALRVRVPGFSLTREQVARLYSLLADDEARLELQGRVPASELAKEQGKDLARLLSKI